MLTLSSYLPANRILKYDLSVQYWIDAAELLASSPLEYTRVATGFFVDYLGMPLVETNMAPFTWAIDIYGRKAAIPGDGDQLISLTHSVDLARYVVKLLDVAEDGGCWDEWSIVVGEDISLNEIVKLAERVRLPPGEGGSDDDAGKHFQVTHDTIEELEKGNATVLPMPGEMEVAPEQMVDRGDTVKELCALFGRLYHYGVLRMPTGNRLTERFKDEIPPLGVEEFLVDAWKGRA